MADEDARSTSRHPGLNLNPEGRVLPSWNRQAKYPRPPTLVPMSTIPPVDPGALLAYPGAIPYNTMDATLLHADASVLDPISS
mgnify:CR=1 FL=1